MTFLELQNYVVEWLDDPNFGYFSQSTVQTWLNRALREVQKQLIQAGENWYITCAISSTVTDQREYTLPSDFLKSHRLEYVSSGTGVNQSLFVITPSTLQQARTLIGAKSGTPSVFVMRKSSFDLYPAPDTPDKTLRLYYSYRVSDMSGDNDVPDCPEQYHEYIAILAALNGYIKDDRAPNSLLEKRNFYLDMMKKDAEDRQQDTPRMVVITETDGDDPWIY